MSIEGPIVNRIASVLAERLAPLNSDGINGIQMSVVSPNARGATPVHGQIAITYGDDVRVPELDVPGSPFRIAKQQTFDICVYIRDESSDAQLTAQAFDVYSQVILRLKPANDWYTFKQNIGTEVAPVFVNLAVDAEVGDLEVIQPNGALGGLKVPVMVKYRTPETAVDQIG